MRARSLLSVLVAVVFTLAILITGPVAESTTKHTVTVDSTTETLAPCIDIAMQSHSRAWICTPSGLTITTDAAGNRPGEPFIPVAPVVPARTEGSAFTLDDYDRWCENGSVCHRTVSNYIGETKGNAAYGNSSGVIGTFDVVLRTNLNGRQAQWRVSLIRDTGPYLQFSNVQVNCWEEISNWPDSSCGVHRAGSPFVRGRWDSGALYGNRLNNPNEYYGAVDGQFTPTGYPIHTMGTLEGAYFNCYGTGNCYYP